MTPSDTHSAPIARPAPDLTALRVFMCVSHYGTGNLRFLLQVLAEWDRLPVAALDVALLCTHPPELPAYSRLRVTIHKFPVEIRKNLPYQHRAIMAAQQGKYDLYVYTEDDVRITQQNVQTFLSLSARLPETVAPGFLVYEQDETMPEPLFVETWIKGHHYPPVGKKVTFGDLTVRLMGNPHQCCYLLSAAHFEHILRHHRSEYLCQPRQIPPRVGWGTIFGGFGPLESAASDVYTNCGLTRVCWLDDLPAISIHHLPNRYLELMKEPIARHELMWPADFKEPAVERWARFDPTARNLYWWFRYGVQGLVLRIFPGLPALINRQKH